ncbi:conserved hypothetical protein [Trichinella spiralis]|nr:conserved hypothetical protein [Trichinella spiralis]
MVGRGGRWYNGVEWVVGGVGWMKECKGKALEGKWICTGYCIIVPAN